MQLDWLGNAQNLLRKIGKKYSHLCANRVFGQKLQQNLAMFEQFTVAKMFRPEVLVLPATIFGEAAGWREQRV